MTCGCALAAAALLLMLNASGEGPKNTTDDALCGLWRGEIQSKTIELRIEKSGVYRWTAQAGNARAEGQGLLMKKAGPRLYVELPFLRREPLEIRLDPSGTKLAIIGPQEEKWSLAKFSK